MSRRNTSRDNVGRRVRRTRRWLWGAGLLVLVLLVIADRGGWLLVPHADDMAAYHGISARVVRIIDGDTFDVEIPDALNDRPLTRIRLWGLDCPEQAYDDRAAEPLAAEAKAFTRALIENELVTLHLEPHRTRGTFGRVIAHVDVPRRGSLNVALLEAGLADTDERWMHAHLSRYAKARRLAQEKEAGLWSPDAMDADASAGETP